MDRFQFIAVVWGTAFTEAFLEFCLPSQLTPNNLPHFAKFSKAIYRIYTRTSDAKIIKNSESYKRLRTLMPVEIAVISGISRVGKYKSMSECHAHSIRTSSDEDISFVFICPDVVWADGAFARLLEIAHSGKRLVAVFTPRLIKENFLPALSKRSKEHRGFDAIKPRELVRMAMEHLHPEVTSMIWNSGKPSSTLFTGLFWSFPQGLLARQFHLFPLMVKPVDRTTVPVISLDADYTLNACPDLEDIYVVCDSDELCGVDFTSVSDAISILQSCSGDVIRESAHWAGLHTHQIHREFVKYKILFHADELPADFYQIEQESDLIVDSILSLADDPSCTKSPFETSLRRYISARFILSKIRDMGVVGFLQNAVLTVKNIAMRKVFGPNLTIRILNPERPL